MPDRRLGDVRGHDQQLVVRRAENADVRVPRDLEPPKQMGPSVLREGDDGGAVLELDRLDADPAGRMLAAAFPQVLVQDIVDENPIRLQVLLHVLPDRLDRPRRSVRAGRRPGSPQGNDHDAFLFLLGHGSRLQLVPPPGPLLRMAGETPFRPLDDPRGHTPVRLDRPEETEFLCVRLVLRHGQRLSILMSRLRGITRSRICRRVASSIIRCTRPLCARAISWFSMFSFSSGYASSIRPRRSLASGVKIWRRIVCRWACCWSRYCCSAWACTWACCSSAILRRRIASSSSWSIAIAFTGLPRTSPARGSSSRGPSGCRARGNRGACGPGR